MLKSHGKSFCLPGPVDDKEKMRKTLKWVQEMSKKRRMCGSFSDA